MDLVALVESRLPAGWRVRSGDFWCHVEPAAERRRKQGWKLHVSATPLSAPLVLARSAEVLLRRGCAFKFGQSLDRVRDLVSHRYDRGGGGKFITVYPECDEDQLVTLAAELHTATEGLPGPGILSDRPFRAGSLVHYRYGVFSGVSMLGNDGSYEAMLVAPDGSLVQDRRMGWFTPPPWVPRDPFTGTRPAAPHGGKPKPVLLNGRYLVREVVRHAYGGGVYRATDEHTGTEVIIKQARPHAGAGETGRDIRDARRHEAAMLERFSSSGRTPRLVELFEQQGELFLVQEAIAGVTLRQWVQSTMEPDDGGNWGVPPSDVERIADQLLAVVAMVHAEGLVLRDFNPSNVMVTEAGEVRLIDLEMLARPGDRVIRGFTEAYAAPEQIDGPRIGPAPGPAVDLYSLGATLFYLVSGTDPLLAPDEPRLRPQHDRIADWLSHLSARNPSAAGLAPAVVALMAADPARRAVPARLELRPAARPAPDPLISDTDLKQLIGDAIEHLTATMTPDNADRLWPVTGFGETTDPFNVQYGAAGVLGVLVRACEAEPDARLREAVATTADWIRRWVPREPRILPGLHFGRSGTAWALLDAGRLLGDERLTDIAIDLARRVPIRWPNPDVCHGSAGAGLTQLRFWEVTGAAEFLDRAREAADALVVAAERRDGRTVWPIPRDFASTLAGLVHYGFAHGVAGVGAFLLAAGRATGESGYFELAGAAADTLVSVAHHQAGAAYWASGEDSDAPRTGWCSGSSGVGTFLLRVGRPELTGLAEAAAVAVRRSRWHAGTAQCHGLSGDAEFLLDLADATGDSRYRDWARELAVSIFVRHAVRDGRLVPPDESRTTVSAGFNTGLAGVLAFLLRLRDGGPRLWLPDSCCPEGR